MSSTPQAPSAAGEHFADAERILAAALPLVKRSADRDRHVQVALVQATLGVAAGLPGEWQTVFDREPHEEPPEHDGLMDPSSQCGSRVRAS